MTLQGIHIQFIKADQQRYETVGDWFYDDTGVLQIRSTGDTEHEAFLIALHEMVEAYLCKAKNISQKSVDDFDHLFATEPHQDTYEPGDDARAPYRKEHRFAMLIEHLTARELGLIDYGVVR